MGVGDFLRALLFQQIADDVSEECRAVDPKSDEWREAFHRMGAAADERHRIVWTQPTNEEQIDMHHKTARWWRP